MSIPTSKNLQTSELSFEDIARFDGADVLLRAWSRGMMPDPDLTVSEWSGTHRWLSSRASAEPGRYRVDRTPYMREIMDALSPGDPAQRVQPTVELAKRNSRQRIDPLIEESPALKDRVRPARARDSGNTQLSKDFPGGVLVMTGANSAVGLRSIPRAMCFLMRSMPIRPRRMMRAIRSRWPRRAR